MAFLSLSADQWWFYLWRVVVLGGIGKHPMLLILLLLIAAILFARLGAGFGLPLLFWHDIAWKQTLAGGAVAVFVAKVLFFAYLLDSKNVTLHSLWVTRLSPEPNPLAFYLVHTGLLVALFSLACLCIRVVHRIIAARTGEDIVALPPFAGVPLFAGAFAGAIFLWYAGHGLLKAAYWFAYGNNLPGTSFPQDLAPLWHTLSPPFNHSSDPGLYATFALLALLMVIEYLLNIAMDLGGTPATGLCNVLSVLGLVYTYLIYKNVSPTVVFLLLLALLPLAGLPKYKLRFDGFSNKRRARGAAASKADADGAFNYYHRDELVKEYHPQAGLCGIDRLTPPGDGRKSPLVLFCASGGGIRAAVWTTRMLLKLEQEIPNFARHVRLITGASGGMVGAAYYCATLTQDGGHRVGGMECRADEMIRRIGDDSLSSVVKQLLFWDVPASFLPFPNWRDRGKIMERTWRGNLNGALDATFHAMRAGEEQGWRPSLVFSPMLVEDGRRVLISNADLDALTTSRGNYIRDEGGVEPQNIYSRSSFSFFRLFPKTHDTFTLATAARMSASFPYITPAGTLPTSPRRRVVDAGYYDNYGVDLAAGWLAGCLNDDKRLQRLLAQASGVLLIEIRDGTSELSGEFKNFSKPAPANFLLRSFDELDAPPMGLFAARDSVSMFRNDTKLDWLVKRFKAVRTPDGQKLPGDFFVPALLMFTGKASLSWYLSDAEKASLKECANSASGKINAIKQWWSAHSSV